MKYDSENELLFRPVCSATFLKRPPPMWVTFTGYLGLVFYMMALLLAKHARAYAVKSKGSFINYVDGGWGLT